MLGRLQAGIVALALAGAAAASAQGPETLLAPGSDQAEAQLRDQLIERIGGEPDSRELLIDLGGVSFRLGDFWNSAIAYKKADALQSLDDDSRFAMAMAFVEIGRPEWASREIEQLANANPKEPLYPYWLGRLDFEQRRYSDAVAHLEEALKINPGFVRAHDRIGLCRQGMGQWNQAIASHQEAARLNREEPEPSAWPPANLGVLLYQLDQVEEAEKALREALGYDAAMPLAHYQLGVLLEKRDLFDEALQHLERAAELDPKDAKPHYALARLYRRTGETQKLEAALQRFQKLERDAKAK